MSRAEYLLSCPECDWEYETSAFLEAVLLAFSHWAFDCEEDDD